MTSLEPPREGARVPAGEHRWRKTQQALLPGRYTPSLGAYDLYPSFPVGKGHIHAGYAALAGELVAHQQVVIDGYSGVLWRHLQEELNAHLKRLGVSVAWVSVDQALKPTHEMEALVTPFLGGDDPIFGTRFTGRLEDFFDRALLASLRADNDADLSILYGSGAALAGWDGLLVYVDLPKNELQFRARAGSVTNLGAARAQDASIMYKRSYFVDWPVLNEHKAALLPRLEIIVDGQRPHEPHFMAGDTLRATLERMSRNYFRVRPWFEPGIWGGQWLKAHVPQLPKDEDNYAWSFELISPENGLILESDGLLLEVSFDFLMYEAQGAVLGDAASRFGHDFPIRFDYLDTMGGGNLSLQCHPRPDYIREHFGEAFTQDETYYILDCEPGALVYLGFQEGTDPTEFRAALERSREDGTPLEVERFIHVERAHKHDLFLIPHGTVHCSGAGNLVLEISATPYIFTFKLHDWLRVSGDGRPRPLNLERAFANLDFSRQGARAAELVSTPRLLASGGDWRLLHLPTHPDHFYDVQRLDFLTDVAVMTEGACHVMNVVEGEAVILETAEGMRQRFHYAETFVVPAAAKHYRLINDSAGEAKVIKAFVK